MTAPPGILLFILMDGSKYIYCQPLWITFADVTANTHSETTTDSKSNDFFAVSREIFDGARFARWYKAEVENWFDEIFVVEEMIYHGKLLTSKI